jgi:hypothetical protein
VLALVPSDIQWVKYINPDSSITYWVVTNEAYVYDTLPNEWIAGWSADALQAGAVVIRSGAYWRTNRSELRSSNPNNNCDEVVDNGNIVYYVTSPTHEQWIPNSRLPATTSATDITWHYHAERTGLIVGRPDPLVPLRYNRTLQYRTRDTTGDWLQRIRYAYVEAGAQGSPFDPNVDCSQTDDQTSTDPIYIQGTPTVVEVQNFRAGSSLEWSNLAIVITIGLTGIGVAMALMVGRRKQK